MKIHNIILLSAMELCVILASLALASSASAAGAIGLFAGLNFAGCLIAFVITND